MRVEIVKDGQTQLVKLDRLQRFLDEGWNVSMSDHPEDSNNQNVKVEVVAEVVEEPSKQVEPDWEDPLASVPTDLQGDE